MDTQPRKPMSRLLCLFALLLVCGLTRAADNAPLRLGVLAFQGKPVATAQWTETAKYLSERLAPRRVELQALTYDEINAAVRENALDLLITNPEHFVALQKAYGLRPLATVASNVNGRPFESFGGVIFTRADTSIRQLEDVKGHKVVGVGLYSLGGFLAQAREFERAGINLRGRDVASLHFTDVPHDRVVHEVMSQRADVGLVRAGVLEGLAKANKLDLAMIRVLHPQRGVDFPFLLSTELYPEWPLAALPHVPGLLAKDVMVAVQAIAPGHVAASTGRYFSFMPVSDYGPVASLMNELHIYPKVDNRHLWEDIWHEYEQPIEIGLAGFLVALLLVLSYVVVQYLRQRRLTDMVRQAQADLRVTAIAFSSEVGLIVTDMETHIIRANAAICTLLGYAESQLLGHSTEILRSRSAAPGSLRDVWHELRRAGTWRGELICQHAHGHDVPCMVTIKGIGAVSGIQGFVASFTDLTQLKRAEAEIRHIAYFDSLTGLPNRRMFMDRLGHELDKAQMDQSLGALMFLDLDHFKVLNDTHGHVFGDQLLQSIAQRLRTQLPTGSMVARLGGDEFVIMILSLAGDEAQALQQAMELADHVHQLMLIPYNLRVAGESGSAKDITYHCSGSVGVTLFGAEHESMAEVLKRADVAMYQAKQDGRNTVRAYEVSVQLALQRKGLLSADLSGALVRDELSLHYQLQTDASERAVGAEVLLRWHHAVHGQVSPAEFIPLAEESGAIIDMGEWVLRSACATLVAWSQRPEFRGLSLSVNVSPRQFMEDSFVPRTQQILDQTGAPAGQLIFEITEGIVFGNADRVIQKLYALRDLGISFSVDDFGTGYSSLSYLQRLPLRQVKIDKAFVQDLTHSAQSEAIVRAILALSHSMGLTVVSEGVETAEQRLLLRTLGCDQFQGYLLGHPVVLPRFEAAILASR